MTQATTAATAATADDKRDNLVRMRSSDLKERSDGGDLTADDALARIREAHAGYKQAIEDKKAVNRTCRDKLEAEEAAFTNAVEEALPASANKAQILGKLERVETQWQELKDAKAGAIEDKKEAKETLKLWREKLDRSIEESNQLRLPGVSDD